MFKMIKPIVQTAKVIENYDTVLLGLNGVLTDGIDVKLDTIGSLISLRKMGKRLIITTNSGWRLATIINFLHRHQVPMPIFEGIVSAGEIMHYKLKAKKNAFGAIGDKYFYVGDEEGLGVFHGLDYNRVDDVRKADFIYFSRVLKKEDNIDAYLPLLQEAAGLSMPLLCPGNDKSCFIDGELALGPGSIAEQYAVMGGKIITIGKPDAEVIGYCLESFGLEKDKTLLVGDNLSTDIKAANAAGVDSILVSKGTHKHFLGNGYIPDVSKTRELAESLNVFPDYVISGFR